MKLEKAKSLAPGNVLYEVDSICGPHQRVVTDELGHSWNQDDPLVSKSHLIRRCDSYFRDGDFYPCFCFYESYDECRRHEMNPWDYFHW